jgi:rhodanese-related sulfurtransferase
LLTLPDDSLVYPAHGAGSLCGKAISADTVSTLGEQRRSNYALQAMSKAAFVDLVMADQPDAPAYFTYDGVLNSKERPTLDAVLARELNPLSLDRVLQLQAEGAQVLDTRDPMAFGAAHLMGSINIGLGGQYATWAGTILSREESIVIIADPGTETESALRLGRIGFDHVVGYLHDGLSSLKSRPDVTKTTQRVSPSLAREFVASDELLAVDVRTPREWEAKRIAGSLGIPLNHLEERLSELPLNRPLLVYCAGGYRSSIAASLLQRMGFTQIAELAGGLAAWETAGLPLLSSPARSFAAS